MFQDEHEGELVEKENIIKLTINIKKNIIGTVLLITTANSIKRALACYCCWSS